MRQIVIDPENFRPVSRRGLSLVELLVSLTILLTIMVGIAGLLESSWQSFSDLKWQNRVDSEARRALDAISDGVRASGYTTDYYEGFPNRVINSSLFNVDPSSTADIIKPDANQDGGNFALYSTENYTIYQPLNHSIQPYLRRNFTGAASTMTATYITDVHFDYEYRALSAPNTTTWTFNTEQNLDTSTIAGNNICYTVKTIYITVTAQFNPYPNSIDSRTYTRTITGAVTMRAPYDMPLPPALP